MKIFKTIHPKRILVRGPDTIGSFVLATPFYRELRKNFPDSYIVLCIKPVVYELAKNCKYINKILLYGHRNFIGIKKVLNILKEERFDTVFLLSGSFESVLIPYLAGIKNRIGYAHDHRTILLTHRIKDIGNKNYIDYILDILECLNYKVLNREPEIYVDTANVDLSSFVKQEILSSENKIIGLGVTALGEQSRSWHKEYTVDLINKLISENVYIFLFGTQKDVGYYDYVSSKVNNNKIIYVLNQSNQKKFLIKLKPIFMEVK